MKKIFLLALSTAFFISCSDDAPVTNVTEEASVEVAKGYDDIFEKYSYFKVDGETITDRIKIKGLLDTAEVVTYLPSERRVHFYTTKSKLEEITQIPVDKLEAYEELEGGIGFGKKFDQDGAIADDVKYPEDISKSYDYGGISGLSSLAGNSTFTDFANKIYFIADYDSGTTYFIRASDDNDLWVGGDMKGIKMTSSVKSANMALGYSFRNLYSYNNLDLSVKNDMGYTRSLYFWENNNYSGQLKVITLSKDQVYDFSRYEFGSFSADRPKSLKIFTDSTDYYCWLWGC
ncbi:hypothetical protein EZY14_019500 [Kordia sp. TARA_039_SRF]|nr:hypothetical protein EZY14_019500 [Kordia sp. TARA_039_SRF]